MNTISIDKCLNMDRIIFIDVRTPNEYNEGSIPGAINIPIFSNEERAYIGNTYVNINKITAKEEGFEIASHKLPDIHKRIKQVAKGYSKIIIFCWRGGLRSKSIATIMSLMSLPAYQLEGGYKAYRTFVLKEFEKRSEIPSPYIVLHGYTGCGKTLLLKALEKKGMPVLDLEGLANHRGSAFGGVGLGIQPPQKVFEANIYEKTSTFKDSLVFVEAESTKIGRRIVPAFAINHIKTGIHVLVNLDKEVRIKRLLDDYMDNNCSVEYNLSYIENSLESIKPYMSKNDFNLMKDYLGNDNLFDFVGLLLDNYYDPMYKKWKKYYGTFEYEIDSSNIDKAVDELIEIYNKESTKLQNFIV